MKKAENKEQAKELIAKAGMELTDDELEMVSGGYGDENTEDENDDEDYIPADEILRRLS